MKKVLLVILLMAVLLFVIVGCVGNASTGSSRDDTLSTIQTANELQRAQPTPTDIDYSLERDNLIRRAYWVNGQREKAISLPCPIERPLGYIALFTEGGASVGSFVVDGKVSSLNSFLTPDSEYFEVLYGGDFTKENKWLADVDGSYGENDNGIFFFTPDGKYIEWTGIYLYSDIPFRITDPVVRYEAAQ